MSAARPIRIAPSLLSADFGRLAAEIAAVEAAGADALHLDVMDGHFVPNLSFGVPVVASIRRCTRLPLDTHLMIASPGRFARAFAEAGSDSLTFHAEAVRDPAGLIREIRGLDVKVGLALNPDTPADAVLPLLDAIDIVLVMTVWPGFGGQSFLDECLPKIAALAARLRPDQALEVDGGVSVETVPRIVAAGADTLVAGSAVFGAGDPAAAVRALRRAAAAVRTPAERTP